VPLVARGNGVDIVNTGHPVCVAPGQIATVSGSGDVFCHNEPVHRKTDTNDPHTHCPPVYSTKIVTHSSNVFVNNLEVARQDDTYDCGAFVEEVTQPDVWANEGYVPPIILSPEVALTVNNAVQRAIANPPNVGSSGGAQANGTFEQGQVAQLYEQTPDEVGVDTLGTDRSLVDRSVAETTAAAEQIPAFLSQLLSEAANNQWDETGDRTSTSNPNIIGIWKELGFPKTSYWQTDQTPWCAGFANWVLKRTGFRYMQSARAYDFRDKTSVYGGVPIPLDQGLPGDIVVWNYSHVNFIYSSPRPGVYTFVGGNQSDRASPTNNNPSGGTITNSWKGGWTTSNGRISGIFRPVRA